MGVSGAAFEVGQVIGEYEVVGVLGRGGLGAVYKAKHLISQRYEALKVLLPEQLGAADMGERFRREIQMLAALNHPNIAGLHNAFYFKDQLVMVMELVEGEDLRSRSRSASIPLPLLIDFASQVLNALEYAHARGVVHRDIKPANIMVTPANQVKLLDFGIAITDRSLDLTAVGALIGSPTHMSPEQVRGEKATPQSDFYSLGVTLYELIAGQPPIRGSNSYELLNAHLHQNAVPLREIRADIPIPLSEAIARSLAKDPAARYGSAMDFLAALRMPDSTDLRTVATVSQLAGWQRISTDEIHKPLTGSASLPLEPVIRHLASFIGPIAKIIVSRLARQYTDLDRLYAEAAKQIESETDRQKFLRTRPR